MAKYFNFFPKTYYLDDSGTGSTILTKITSRFAYESSFKENTSVFYKYTIKDSDTPEGIAYKMYGSSERHWMILMLNDIIDPLHDWPLNYDKFTKFVNSKYTANANTANGQTGLSWSQSNIKEYYKIITHTHPRSDTISVNEYLIDANTYANVTNDLVTTTLSDGAVVTITTTKKTKTYYEYESDLNEPKRLIKILKPEFAPEVEAEFRRVMRNVT